MWPPRPPSPPSGPPLVIYFSRCRCIDPFPPGTENVEFEKRLRDAGIETEQSCTLVLLATNQY